jgi:hypothetical protein
MAIDWSKKVLGSGGQVESCQISQKVLQNLPTYTRYSLSLVLKVDVIVNRRLVTANIALSAGREAECSAHLFSQEMFHGFRCK